MEELKNTMQEETTIFYYEQFADSLTEEQRELLTKHYNDMLEYAAEELAQYEFLKTKSSLVEFMDLAGRAFEMRLLLDVEENEMFINVFLGYERMLRELEKEEYGY